MKKAEWKKDAGYSWCKTARFGEIAVVICPPEFRYDQWGYQAFDESDEEAVMYVEVYAEDYGFASEQAVIDFVEGCMA